MIVHGIARPGSGAAPVPCPRQGGASRLRPGDGRRLRGVVSPMDRVTEAHDNGLMLTLGASMAATLAGFLVDMLVESWLSLGGRVLVGLVVSAAVYVWAYRELKKLRDG
jgi:hypothetical protein